MSEISIISLYALTTILGYLISVSNLNLFLPQIVAIISIIYLITLHFKHVSSPYIIALLVNVLVFSTNGLGSPLLFLDYFLLFVIAFQNTPIITLGYSFVIVFFLAQSLNSSLSLIPLISLLFITPLAWLIGRQIQTTAKLQRHVGQSQTDVFLWLSLQFKTSLVEIIDSTSQLLGNPHLSHTEKSELHKINELSHHLLLSSQDLTQTLDSTNDET
jgi:hypothetical protein